MMKKKFSIKRLLALVIIMIMVVSQSFTISVSVDTLTIEGSDTLYLNTPVMVADDDNKHHDTQPNYQDVDTEVYTYSTKLLQTAEWTDKATGEAELNIYYSAEFADIVTRVLYIFNVCTVHGFSSAIAAENITELLYYYEYVDVIMIDGTNYRAYGDHVAVAMFSMFRSDFYTEGYDTDDIVTEIETVLEDAANIEYKDNAHEIGSEDSGSEGKMDVLYNEYSEGGAPTYLSFTDGRHCGMYFTPYYIQEYYEIITANYGDFSTTVDAIYNSFDGFATVYKNSVVGANHPATSLYSYVDSEIGLDLKEEMTLSTLMLDDSKVREAVEILVEYDEDGRYIVLTSDATTNLDQSTINSEWFSDTYISATSVKNEILYTLFLINPSGTMTNEDDVKSNIEEWTTTGKTFTMDDELFGDYVYTFDQGLATLGLLSTVSEQKEITITSTVHGDFIVDKDKIKVTLNTSDFILSDLSVEYNDGETVITVTLTSTPSSMLSTYSTTDICDVQITILATLAGNEFHDDGEFGLVKTEDTEVTVNRMVMFEAGTTRTYGETLSVEPTALYKYSPIVFVPNTSTVGVH